MALVGVALTNRATVAVAEKRLVAEATRESVAARLVQRDSAYEEVIREAVGLFLSFRRVQDYGSPDRGAMDHLLTLEARLLLYAPDHVLEATLAYVDRCEELATTLHAGYPFAYLHDGRVMDTGDLTVENAYVRAVEAYRNLVSVVRGDLTLGPGTGVT